MNCWAALHAPQQFIQTFLDSVVWTQCVRMIAEDDSPRKNEESFRMSEVASLLGEKREAFQVEEKPGPVPPKLEPAKRLKPIDRSQSFWGAIDIEKLIEEDHPARGIGAMVNQLDMTRREQKTKVVEVQAGQSS